MYCLEYLVVRITIHSNRTRYIIFIFLISLMQTRDSGHFQYYFQNVCSYQESINVNTGGSKFLYRASYTVHMKLQVRCSDVPVYICVLLKHLSIINEKYRRGVGLKKHSYLPILYRVDISFIYSTLQQRRRVLLGKAHNHNMTHHKNPAPVK